MTIVNLDDHRRQAVARCLFCKHGWSFDVKPGGNLDDLACPRCDSRSTIARMVR